MMNRTPMSDGTLWRLALASAPTLLIAWFLGCPLWLVVLVAPIQTLLAALTAPREPAE